jgi:signal transduction histidine kinase
VLLANRKAASVLERSCDELTGASVDTVLAPLDWLLNRARMPSREQRTRVMVLPSGRRITAGFSIGAAPTEGSGKNYAILFQDLSEWAALREERDRLLKIAGIGSVLPSLLHEIKNTLAAITATVEVLAEEVETSPARDQVHAILTEVRRMKLSLDGVATVGRQLRGSRYSPIDQTCRDAWQIMATRGRSLGLFSRCNVEDMPLLALDPAVVGGVVHNLMLNAIQACVAGQAVNVQAQLRDQGTRFTLTVVDNGPGMTAEIYARCTELFFTTKRNGSGIGLALCRRIAEEAGGTLTIESVNGFGTSVTMDVPVHPIAPIPRQEPSPLAVSRSQ